MTTTNIPRRASGIDTLVFDLDGTLTDNYAGISACIAHALTELGIPVPDEPRLRACVGPPLRASFREFLETDETDRIELAIAHYRTRFDVEGWRENLPYAGIDVTLSALAGLGYRMLVCTSKPQRYADRIIDHFGLRDHFSAVHGPDLGGTLDDKRALLARAIATSSIDPARAVMIGDRAQDMRAAAANKMRGVGVLYGYGSTEELLGAGASVLCETVEALPSVIGAM